MPDEILPPDDDDLAEFRSIARRVGSDPVGWETPPAGLWERIAAEAHDETPHREDEAGAELSRVTPISAASSRRRGWWSLAAAAAVIVVGVAGILVWSLRSDTPVVVAQAELEQLGDSGDGRAELIEGTDGGFVLRVATNNVDLEPGTFAEVWVINAEVTEMISLGPLRSDGRYEIPRGLDPAGFPIVDVSIEPFDGNPTHSGNSVLRGQLAF